jgi:hypothetical protein
MKMKNEERLSMFIGNWELRLDKKPNRIQRFFIRRLLGWKVYNNEEK